MTVLTLVDEPSRLGLPMIIAVTGIVDAGRCASGVGEHLMTYCSPRRIAEFDTDALFDFRVQRGSVMTRNGRAVAASLPGLVLLECTDETGEPFLLLGGSEPDLRWPSVAAEFAELCDRLEVSVIASVGGLSWSAPHTMPLRFVGSGSDPLLNARHPQPAVEMTVPVTLSSLFEMAMADRREVVGLLAKIPQYAASEQYDPGVVGLLHEIGLVTRRTFPLAGLDPEAVLARLARHTASFAPLRGLVTALEAHYVEEGSAEADAIPDAEELAEQVQAYLDGRS